MVQFSVRSRANRISERFKRCCFSYLKAPRRRDEQRLASVRGVGRCPSQGPATAARTCSAVPPQQRKRRAGRRPRGCSSRRAAYLLVATSCDQLLRRTSSDARAGSGLLSARRRALRPSPAHWARCFGTRVGRTTVQLLELPCSALAHCRSSKLTSVRSGGLEPNAYTLLLRSRDARLWRASTCEVAGRFTIEV